MVRKFFKMNLLAKVIKKIITFKCKNKKNKITKQIKIRNNDFEGKMYYKYNWVNKLIEY